MTTAKDSRSADDAKPAAQPITIRPFTEADRPFYQRIAPRLQDADATPTRPADVMSRYFARRSRGEIDDPPGTEAFVATDAAGNALGLLMLYPSEDYFTGEARAYIDILVVSAEAEGTGTGRALMTHAETWARDHGLTQIALDVFAGNDRARAFYTHLGFQPDFLRLIKPA